MLSIIHHRCMLIVLTTISMVVFEIPSEATSLNPQQLITRCFSVLGKIRLPAKDPRRALVPTLSHAHALCDALIDAPVFNANGIVVSNSPNITAAEALEVVRTFHDFYRSSFSRESYTPLYTDEQQTPMIFDPTAPAAYFTLATFGASSDYSLALTASKIPNIIRDSINSNALNSRWGNLTLDDTNAALSNRSKVGAVDGCANQVTHYLEGVDRGDLYGMSFPSPNLMQKVLDSISQSSLIPKTVCNVDSVGALSYGSTITDWQGQGGRSLGGGFIGNPSFILLNMGFMDRYTQANGAVAMSRRWTNEVFKVAFCRTPPFLTLTDGSMPANAIPSDWVAPANVQSNPTAAPFRTNYCLKCHATMDPFAMALKNVALTTFGYTDPISSGSGYSPSSTHARFFSPRIYSGSYDTSNVSLTSGLYWPFLSDSNFHKRTTDGQLRFTDIQGNLQVENFNVNTGSNSSVDLTNLGTLLSTKRDYYYCGAKRFFQLLTGVDLKMTIPRGFGQEVSNMNSIETYIWNQSGSFKNHKSVRTLLKALTKSAYFKDSGFGFNGLDLITYDPGALDTPSAAGGASATTK